MDQLEEVRALLNQATDAYNNINTDTQNKIEDYNGLKQTIDLALGKISEILDAPEWEA